MKILSVPENPLLSDKVLKLKFFILSALTSASKAYELTNLSIDSYAKSATTYIFFPHKLTRTWLN